MAYTPQPKNSTKDDATGILKIEAGTIRDPYFEGRSDREIWNMFRDGHAGAFRHIYMHYFNLLYVYGARITDDSELVKDAIQEVFIALRKSRSLSETDSIKFYLFRALRWRIYRKLDRRQKFMKFHKEAAGFDPVYEESREVSLIREQESSIKQDRVNRALKKLTKRQREALYYFYEQGLSYQQVAEIMQLSNIKSARNLIYDCVVRLKKAVR